MPWNLLLPPLLGGYIFITRFNGTAYRVKSYSGYRLVFSSSVMGLILLILAVTLDAIVRWSTDPLVFHGFLIPGGVSGTMLVLFGSWKTMLANTEKSERYETDSEADYEAREESRISDLKRSRFWLWVSITALVFIVAHAVIAWGLAHISWILALTVGCVLLVVTIVNYVKARSDLRGYQVAFRLGIAVLIATALFGVFTVLQPDIEQSWGTVIPFEFAGVSLLSFALGCLLWIPANSLYPYEAAVGRLVETGDVDGLESLFYYAQITFQQVCVTLEDEKIYVGYVDNEIPIKGLADDYVQIIPTASGYRRLDDRRFVFTTFYIEPFEKAINDGEDLSKVDLAKILPIDRIRSASIFNPTLYSQFQLQEPDEDAQLSSGVQSHMPSSRDRLKRRNWPMSTRNRMA